MKTIKCPDCGFATDASELATFGECRGCGWTGEENDDYGEWGE